MKRLLQISLDILLISILPVIMWLLLGFIISKDIAGVFSLTYPIQFFFMLFISIFVVGPNITSKKINNDNVVYSNMIIGPIIVGIIALILILNVDNYIRIMNMNVNIYHNFCLYSIIWMYFSFIMQSVTQKLYYDEKNTESNRINIIFNLTNFILIILLSLITRNQILSIFITLIITFIILIYEYIRHLKLKKLEIHFIKNIRYTSFEILGNISMFFIYGIGYGNSFSYGKRYIDAINFEGLTTDTQWDCLSSVDIVANIDISENNLNYKEHLKNAYKLLSIIFATTIIMNVALYWYYKPDINILILLLGIQLIDMIFHPINEIKMRYLQINSKGNKHNVFYAILRIIRIMMSFIPSAFCTYIGQLFSMIYLYIYSKIACKNIKVFKL